LLVLLLLLSSIRGKQASVQAKICRTFAYYFPKGRSLMTFRKKEVVSLFVNGSLRTRSAETELTGPLQSSVSLRDTRNFNFLCLSGRGYVCPIQYI
jgi:hypothetical protein